MDIDYELSQQLQGHQSHVRCLALLGDGTLISGGLDAKVIMWKAGATGSYTLHKTLGHHSETVYTVAASQSTPGAFYSGSKDKLAVRLDAEGNPVMQFEGHEGPVSCIVERGAQVITGAWDGKARVFEVSSGELRHTLDAGAHAVTVAVLPTGEVVTGSQDRSLRVFRGAECITKIDEAHGDIIRGISVASTHLVSASNDQSLKMWSFDGIEMHCISGHQSFVYSVTHSQDNQMVLSSSDDCTVKLWSLENTQCKQSIMHAGTVWQTVTLPTGDFITACGDMIIRIWTRDPERMAPAAERQTQKEMAEQHSLQAAAKGSSSTAMESAADISQMPSAIGKKNGEIRCFKDGGTVFAFSWNAGARIWDKIGEVVGQKEDKKQYPGDQIFPAGEYDFVFDVDMGPSLGMRQLPFNRGQNPMEVAESFCSREQIHKSNVEQIRQFIIQNTGGGGGAPAAQAPAAQPPSAPAAPESSMFPIMTPVAFKDGKFEPLQKKILEFNEQVDASLKLDPTELLHLNEAITKLKSGIMSKEFRDCEKEIIHVRLKQWPGDKLFPVLDLWRLFLAHPQSADFFKGTDRGASFIFDACQFLNGDINGPVGLCSARYLANLFLYQTNKYAIFDKRAYVLKNIEPAMRSTNKNTRLATVTVLLNLAIVLHESSIPPKKWDGETGEEITRLALAFIAGAGADDAASVHTAFLAIGSLLPRDRQNGSDICRTCKAQGLIAKLEAQEATVGAAVVREMKKLMA